MTKQDGTVIFISVHALKNIESTYVVGLNLSNKPNGSNIHKFKESNLLVKF